VLYFFLSYARGDDDEYVERFFHDLCAEVRVLTGLSREVPVGFLDNHSIGLGQPWQATLVDALSSCHAFLALCSPAYFFSEPCGKEWAIFEERSQRDEVAKGPAPSALIPLAWVSPRRMREPAQTRQYSSDILGDAYTKGGLRQLLRLQRNRDEYLEFVSAIAELIVQAGESPVPPPVERPDFDRTSSVFHRTPPPTVTVTEEGGPTIDGAPVTVGSDHVYFVIAAPSAAEAANIRTDVRYYGGHPEDWTPYRPELEQPLGQHATRVAAGRRLGAALATIEQLDRCIQLARQHNQVVVVLIDAWSTRLERSRALLKQYDERNEPTTAVLVPWSHTDAETQRNGPTLTESLRQTLANNCLRDDVLFRPRVLTHEAFGADLSVVLEVARNRVFARGNPYRRPSTEHVGSRTILEAPQEPR
jgi:FxsC-like protein